MVVDKFQVIINVSIKWLSWLGYWWDSSIRVVRIDGFVINGMVSGIRKGFFFVDSLVILFLGEGKIILIVIKNKIMLLDIDIVLVCKFKNVRIFLLVNRKISINMSVISNLWINIICCCLGFRCLSIDIKIGKLFSGFIIKNSNIVVVIIFVIIILK